MRLAALAFLGQVKKDEEAALAKRHTWEPSVSVGVLFDTNVNAGPSSDILPAGLVMAPGSLPQGDTAAVLQAGLTHRYNAPQAVRIGESAASFGWQSQANLFHRDYSSEHAFNMSVLTLATGPSWLVRNKWRANINLQADDITFGSEHLALYTSVNPSFTWEIKEGEVTLDASALHKDFSRTVDIGRDSNFYSAGLSMGKLFKAGKVAVQGGVKTFQEDADLARFTNDGFEYFIGANLVAWNNGTLFGRVSQKESKYDGVEPIFAIARDESERRYEVGFNHAFKTGMMKDWKLGGSYLKTDNSSNVSIYDYEREMTSINLSRSF